MTELYGRLVPAPWRRQMERRRERVTGLARRRVLTEPGRVLRESTRRLDDGARAPARRRAHAITGSWPTASELATNALSSQHPLARISNGAAVLAQLRGRLAASASHRAKVSRHRFAPRWGVSSRSRRSRCWGAATA